MAEEIIGLLFGVEGGSDINAGSGKLIVDDLSEIVKKINNGESKIPKIKLEFDVSEISGVVDSLKNKLKDIEKIASVKATGKGGATQDIQKQIEKYRELSTAVKKWVQTSKQGAKLSKEYSSINRAPDGTLSGSVEGYKETIAAINATNKAMKDLRITFGKDGKPIKPDAAEFAKIAKEIGITEDQYRELFEQVQAGSVTASQSVENAQRKNQQSWTNTASKVRDEVQRMYDTIAKDPNSKRMADELLEYTKSATGDVGDLKNKFDEFRNTVHESGADVETWGDKFKKTFAGKVRSALAGAITAAFTKYLREIYLNVVAIDKAIVNLQIASGKNREEVKQLTKEYSKLAQQLGATTVEVAEAADTWLRQGYSAEESSTLITNSMMLSKLGQMESAEASTALTSAMKGYGVAVEDSIKIVDKFTKVDMEAAASAGDIAAAMAETSASAKLAGVSMDTLIGYIATVKEVTQDSSESVGTFLKTLFARMNNVAAGNFIDEETGESLNDVEIVLGELGIALRDVSGEFRNSGEVLNEVATRWKSFDSVAQHAIATAFAGTRQQEKFLVLMQNYGTAMKYATTATESAGTAMEKFGAYTEGVEGKINSLKATFEELSQTILNSDLIVIGADVLNDLLSALNGILSFGDNAIMKIGAIVGVTYLVIAACVKLDKVITAAKSNIKELIRYQTALQASQAASATTTSVLTAALVKYSSTGLLGVITFVPRAIAAMIKFIAVLIKQKLILHSTTKIATLFNKTMGAFNVSPWGLGITAAISLIVGAIAVIKNYQKELENSAKQTQAAVDATIALNDKLKEEKETLDDLIKSYYELAKANEGVYDSDAQEKVLEIQNQINEIIQEQGSSVDLLNAKYSELGETMKKLAGYQAVQRNKSIEETKESIKIIEDAALKETDNQIRKILNNLTTGTYTSGDLKNISSISSKSSLKDTFAALKECEKVFDDLNIDISGLVNQLNSYQSKIDTLTSSLIEFALGYEDALARSNGGFGDDGVLSNLDEYAVYKKALLDAIKSNKDFAASGEEALNAVEAFMQAEYGDTIAQLALDLYGTNYQLKGFSKLAEEATKEFDALMAGFSDMEERGALSLDAYQELLEVFPDLKNMEFVSDDGRSVKFLEETANGYYKLNGSIEDYIKLEREKLVAVIASNAAGSEAHENAKEDLENLIRIQNTLLMSREIEESEKRLEGQLENFENLIDLRKELLETYKDEVDYQRELKKRQQEVADLQTKLSVSRLDTSAAGQARTRELEQELKDAQDELDDFTLEHAIDVLVTQLDAEKQEYKALINEEIEQLKSVQGSIEAGFTNINEAIDGLLKERALDKEKASKDEAALKFNELQQYVKDNKITAGGKKDSTYDDKLTAAVEASKNAGIATTKEAIEGQISTWYVPEKKEEKTSTYTYVSEATLKNGSKINPSGAGYDNFSLMVGGTEYRLELNEGSKLGKKEKIDADLAVTSTGDSLAIGSVVKKEGVAYVRANDEEWYKIKAQGGEGRKNEYTNFMNVLRKYHTGGFVGDKVALNSNEEFAKLLKGEFVSTPSQMKHFMENTLPRIANYTTTGSSNEFNAPLVEILCQSVTTESLPGLERVVNEAVKEIKKQLDSGMSRTGYKRQTTKRLT